MISIDTDASEADSYFREIFSLNMRAVFEKAMLKERKKKKGTLESTLANYIIVIITI